MSTPCRASTCDHLQCFDANLYLMMNEKKPKWMCPVCNKAALYENLLIDGYFSDVLNSKRLPTDEHEIVLQNDASWDPQVPAKKPHDGDKKPKMEPLSPPSPVQETSKKVVPTVETLDLDDDSDDSPTPTPALKVPQKKSIEVDYVTLDSDTDDEEPDIAPPASKRPRMNAFLDDLDDNSDSVSALTPNSVSPPPKASTSSTKNNPMLVNNPPESPPLICLDDD
jgi:E3 SUMO-protein ligase PIAS1